MYVGDSYHSVSHLLHELRSVRGRFEKNYVHVSTCRQTYDSNNRYYSSHSFISTNLFIALKLYILEKKYCATKNSSGLLSMYLI